MYLGTLVLSEMRTGGVEVRLVESKEGDAQGSQGRGLGEGGGGRLGKSKRAERLRAGWASLHGPRRDLL